MTTKFAVVEHYPDGNSSIIAMFLTEKQAQDYADQNNRWLLDDELPLTITRVQTMTVSYGQTVSF